MKDRLIRFSFTGIAFPLAILFSYWLSGGDILYFLSSVSIDISQTDKTIWIPALAAVISSPLLGFMLSSLTRAVVRLILMIFYWKKVAGDFLPPKKGYEQLYLRKIFVTFGNQDSGVGWNNSDYTVEAPRKIYINHQILLRKNFNEEIILFSQRRMDFYSTQTNTVFAILLGMVFGVVYQYPNLKAHCYQFSMAKLLWFLLVLGYIIVGSYLAWRNLDDSNDFEKRVVLKYF
ncbi:MAG TPA: hypothetical protein VHB48_21995 [Chitinophagaceae bacterium]|nr:hypothetical protein [Chitinophagaceae bacterium]